MLKRIDAQFRHHIELHQSFALLVIVARLGKPGCGDTVLDRSLTKELAHVLDRKSSQLFRDTL
jgi:hypothetical protein